MRMLFLSFVFVLYITLNVTSLVVNNPRQSDLSGNTLRYWQTQVFIYTTLFGLLKADLIAILF